MQVSLEAPSLRSFGPKSTGMQEPASNTALTNGCSVFWCNAGLGLACLPDFWERVARGPVRIHRTDIKCLGKGKTVYLADGTTFQTDLVIACTGYVDDVPLFSEQECAQLGLPLCNRSTASEMRWDELERKADREISSKFLILGDR